MATIAQYQSKPLECMAKLMEVRRQFTREMWAAKEKGELLLMGTPGQMHALPAGLGTYYFFGGLGPNFARIVEDPALLKRVKEATEEKGYGADCCGTLRVSLGAMFAGLFDLNPRTGERVRPDFMLEMQNCQAQGKTAQLWHQYYGVPYFFLEMAPGPRQMDFLLSQMYEAVEWMEQVTGREYNDEWLIEALHNEWQTRILWAEICEFQKAIPAPLSDRTLWNFQTLTWRGGRHRRETVDFLRLAKDEVKDRVENKVAFLSTERFRLQREGQDSWYESQVHEYPQRYGALLVCSFARLNNGAWIMGEDGSLQVAPTMEELGLEPRTRDDALRALAELYSTYAPGIGAMHYLEDRVKERLRIAEDWHIDGVVFRNDTGCRGGSLANMETMLAFRAKGIPVTSYEADSTFRGEFNMAEYMARMDEFLESLGLKPLE